MIPDLKRMGRQLSFPEAINCQRADALIDHETIPTELELGDTLFFHGLTYYAGVANDTLLVCFAHDMA